MTEPLRRSVMFVDVRESSHLYETMGDVAAQAVVRRCMTVCQRHVLGAGGIIVKNLGDGLMAAFDEGVSAVCAAQEIQRSLSEQQLVRLGIGLHAGQVLEKDGDLYGDVVNVASRLCSLARAGEILASSEATKDVPAALCASLQNIDAFFVKGRREPIQVVRVHWDRTTEETLFVQNSKKRSAPQHLRIEAPQRSYVMGRNLTELTVGRTDADIILVHQMVSRRHAVIRYTGESFVLADQSLNGTFVHYDTGHDIILRREATDVSGTGVIGFGNPPSVAATCIRFASS